MIPHMLNALNKFVAKRPWNFSEARKYSKITRLCPQLEESFNKQINIEYFASFTYLAMAVYFGRQCVALPGCHKYFHNQFQDEQGHAQKLIDYLNQRSSTVLLQTIPAPKTQTWNSPLAAFKDAMNLEKNVSEYLFDLHKASEELEDVCSSNLIENYLDNQLDEYNKLARIVAQLESIGENGLGIYLFDINLLKELKEET